MSLVEKKPIKKNIDKEYTQARRSLYIMGFIDLIIHYSLGYKYAIIGVVLCLFLSSQVLDWLLLKKHKQYQNHYLVGISIYIATYLIVAPLIALTLYCIGFELLT